MKGGAKPTEKLLLFYKLSFEAEAKTLSLHSASKRSFSKPVSLWSCALHTAVTFLCEESYQRHTKNLLVFGFPAEGGVPPSIPPVNHETFVIDKGERDRFAVTAGRDGFSQESKLVLLSIPRKIE